MLAKWTSSQAPKGTVGIEILRGTLRLKLPRSIFGGQQKYISTGLQDTPENFKKTQMTAWEIEADISSGNFDHTLAKYQPQQHLAVAISIQPKTVLKLDELWERYTDYKAESIEQTTIKTNYKRIKNTITLFPIS